VAAILGGWLCAGDRIKIAELCLRHWRLYKFETVVPAGFETAARIMKGRGTGARPSGRSALAAGTSSDAQAC